MIKTDASALDGGLNSTVVESDGDEGLSSVDAETSPAEEVPRVPGDSTDSGENGCEDEAAPGQPLLQVLRCDYEVPAVEGGGQAELVQGKRLQQGRHAGGQEVQLRPDTSNINKARYVLCFVIDDLLIDVCPKNPTEVS